VSAGLLLAGGLLPLTGVLAPASGALIAAIWGGAFLLVLPFTVTSSWAARGYLVPNVLTGVRGGAAVLLLLAVGLGWIGGASGLSRTGAWTLFAVLALVETTDFFDGHAARRARRPAAESTPPFGALWDMENDALFTFALSYTIWIALRFPVYVLLIGWMRYLYFALARFQGDPPDYPERYKLFAKTVAASIVVVLIGAFAPILPRSVRIGAVTIVLVLQIISFSWDFLLHFRARRARRSRRHRGGHSPA
nr:CDP-alcohol phosphatidyltransferase family protein [Spirochaeta sp.]